MIIFHNLKHFADVLQFGREKGLSNTRFFFYKQHFYKQQKAENRQKFSTF